MSSNLLSNKLLSNKGIFGVSPVKIEGQSVVPARYTGAIAKNDRIYGEADIVKLADPASAVGGSTSYADYSSDGQYLAIAANASPYIAIYKITGGTTFTKLSNPATLPTGQSLSVMFSPDTNYLAVAHNTSPFLTIYKRSGDTFTKLADPSILPADNCRNLSWTANSSTLYVTSNATPYFLAYSRSGDTFTKLANPDILPDPAANGCIGCGVSPDGTYLIVGQFGGSGRIRIYKRVGSNHFLQPNPTVMPTDAGLDVKFRSDGLQVAIATSVKVYRYNIDLETDTFTYAGDPDVLVAVRTVSYSPDNKWLAFARNSSPFFGYYDIDGVFKLMPDPSILPPASSGGGVALSPDGNMLTVAFSGSGPTYHTTYEKYGDMKVTKATSLSQISTKVFAGYAPRAGVENDIKEVVLLFK